MKNNNHDEANNIVSIKCKYKYLFKYHTYCLNVLSRCYLNAFFLEKFFKNNVYYAFEYYIGGDYNNTLYLVLSAHM